MTKIVVTRVFEKAILAGKQAAQDLDPFIDYVNRLADNVIRILNNGVALSDNLNAYSKTLSLKHNTEVTFAVPTAPVGVFVMKQNPVANPITSFVWFLKTDKTVSVIATFANTPTDPIDVTLWVQNT